MAFNQLLTTLLERIDGALAASFCGIDGIAVETVTFRSDLEQNEAEVQIATMLKILNRVVANLEVGEIKSFLFEAEKMVGLLEKCGEDYFIAVLLKPNGNIGRARHELHQLSQKMKNEV
jgi:predicted regulator of Ras-like GTPase activity (Roadblock/LC7/MglB family)